MPSYKARNQVPYETSNFTSNPYDDFMRKHLSHYGYYTERNTDYNKKNSLLFNDFNRTHGYQLSSSDSENDGDPSEDVNQDAKSKQLEFRFEAGRLVSRLREPRQLFAITNPSLGPQQLPRWPAELEVAIEKLKHSLKSPSTKEPFYIKNGMELQPALVSLEEGRTVYQLQNDSSPFFLHSRVGGNRNELRQASVELSGPEDTTLLFESRFESGNLAKAVQIGKFSYELWLRNDLYTNKHTQWFYFQIKNTRKGQKYRFTICNFMKSNSLYNDGMKPCYYSEKDHSTIGLGWRRMGSDITYYKSNYSYANGKSEKAYYALTFTQTAAHDDDAVYLSHCYPYTYSDLQDYLGDVVEDERKSKICKLRILTRSLAGNVVYLLTITSPYDERQPIVNKKAVVVTARVHPGETNGSWMMKGLLDYILGDSADAKLLRDTFIFKIVPMLNPDGVIVGNYRCSLAGRDLNRNYKTQLTESYPTIMGAKTMIKKLLVEREVVLYCDLHGHSRKQNVFIYGCENRTDRSKRLHERIFPAMLGKNCPDKFVFDECSFKVQKGKEGTGRIVMWNMGITNSFTMEATFCGSSVGNKRSCHFNMCDFESMGYHFCDTLLDYCDPDKTKYDVILSELEDALKKQILNRFARLGKTNIMLNNKLVDLQDPNLNVEELLAAGVDMSDDDGGSDSSVSDGLPVNIEYMQNKSNSQKRKALSRKERDKLRKSSSQGSLSTGQGNGKSNRPKTSSSAKNGSASRVSSATSRHENCHHNQPLLKDKPSRRCLSAKHALDTPSSGSSDRTVPYRGDTERSEEDNSGNDVESQRAYLASITRDYIPNGGLKAKPMKGHLRYSTSNSNRPLAMNLDELTENQPECSFSAQYLLTRVNNADAKQSGGHGDDPAWLANGEVTTETERFLYPLSENPVREGRRSVTNSKAHNASWNYSARQRDADRKAMMAHSKHQAVKQVDMSSALEGNVIKQHPLPFDTISKPGVTSKVFVFGQGTVERSHSSRPFSTKQPTRQRTADRSERTVDRSERTADRSERTADRSEHLKDRTPADTGELQQQLSSELKDIEHLQETLCADIANTNIKSSSGMNSASRKYLEKIVMETDNDIEQLRKELSEMSAENANKHPNKNNILELAARQRRLSTSQKTVVTPTNRAAVDSRSKAISHSSNSSTVSDLHLTNQLPSNKPATKQANVARANRFSEGQQNSTQNRFINQYARSTQPTKELIQITSKVSVHMSNHPIPSAPKASRRGQVRIVPSSKQGFRK